MVNQNKHVRIVHIVPLYVAGHVHVFGALHVPPFEHVGEQTALRRKLNQNLYFLENDRHTYATYCSTVRRRTRTRIRSCACSTILTSW